MCSRSPPWELWVIARITEVVSTYKTSLNIYQTTWHNVLEDSPDRTPRLKVQRWTIANTAINLAFHECRRTYWLCLREEIRAKSFVYLSSISLVFNVNKLRKKYRIHGFYHLKKKNWCWISTRSLSLSSEFQRDVDFYVTTNVSEKYIATNSRVKISFSEITYNITWRDNAEDHNVHL